MKILIFGASTTYGKYDPDGGWAQRLRKHIDENAKITNTNAIFNLGVSGDTSEDLLRRFEFETGGRIKKLKENEDLIFIFSIGVNDSKYNHTKNKMEVEPGKFRENIGNLIQMARKFSPKIVFIGSQPVDDSRVDPAPWNTTKSFRLESIKQFNQIVEEVCKEESTHFIEILSEWSQSDHKNLLEDGLHPNAAGHKKIFELVRDFLTKQKII